VHAESAAMGRPMSENVKKFSVFSLNKRIFAVPKTENRKQKTENRKRKADS